MNSNNNSTPTPSQPIATSSTSSSLAPPLSPFLSSSSSQSGSYTQQHINPHLSTYRQNLTVKFNEIINSIAVNKEGSCVCLGGKKALHIVDLESLKNVKVLPQQSKWEVSVVDWNNVSPNLIASSSNQDAFIWDIENTKFPLIGQFVSHNRAISDLSWSIFDQNLLATTSADSFVNLWDLRVPKRAMKVKSFNSHILSAIQVKWNKFNPNILASAHESNLMIWDIRKETQELNTTVHSTKVYGIDWSPLDTYEILTSSQDKTVKIWSYTSPKPKHIITTSYPVLRAKYLPTGKGLVTISDRGENHIRLWSFNDLSQPISTLAGHSDCVRSFDFRVGNKSDPQRDLQIVSWSKDQHLRLWKLDDDSIRSQLQLPLLNNTNTNTTTTSTTTPSTSTTTNTNNIVNNTSTPPLTPILLSTNNLDPQLQQNISASSSSSSLVSNSGVTPPTPSTPINITSGPDSSNTSNILSPSSPYTSSTTTTTTTIPSIQQQLAQHQLQQQQQNEKETMESSYTVSGNKQEDHLNDFFMGPKELEYELKVVQNKFIDKSLRIEQINIAQRMCVATCTMAQSPIISSTTPPRLAENILRNHDPFLQDSLSIVSVQLRIVFPSLYPQNASPHFECVRSACTTSLKTNKIIIDNLNEVAQSRLGKPCFEQCLLRFVQVMRKVAEGSIDGGHEYNHISNEVNTATTNTSTTTTTSSNVHHANTTPKWYPTPKDIIVDDIYTGYNTSKTPTTPRSTTASINTINDDTSSTSSITTQIQNLPPISDASELNNNNNDTEYEDDSKRSIPIRNSGQKGVGGMVVGSPGFSKSLERILNSPLSSNSEFLKKQQLHLQQQQQQQQSQQSKSDSSPNGNSSVWVAAPSLNSTSEVSLSSHRNSISLGKPINLTSSSNNNNTSTPPITLPIIENYPCPRLCGAVFGYNDKLVVFSNRILNLNQKFTTPTIVETTKSTSMMDSDHHYNNQPNAPSLTSSSSAIPTFHQHHHGHHHYQSTNKSSSSSSFTIPRTYKELLQLISPSSDTQDQSLQQQQLPQQQILLNSKLSSSPTSPMILPLLDQHHKTNTSNYSSSPRSTTISPASLSPMIYGSGGGGSSSNIAGGVGNLSYNRPFSSMLSISHQLKIINISSLSPINFNLANSYTLNGTIEEICKNNLMVANSVNRKDLIKLWSTLGQITDPNLFNLNDHRFKYNKHLKRLSRQTTNEFIDDNWPVHPLGRPLVQSFMEYYNKIGDVQTLAMITCVLIISAQQLTKSIISNSVGGSSSSTSYHLSGGNIQDDFNINNNNSNNSSTIFGNTLSTSHSHPNLSTISLASSNVGSNSSPSLLPSTPNSSLLGASHHQSPSSNLTVSNSLLSNATSSMTSSGKSPHLGMSSSYNLGATFSYENAAMGGGGSGTPTIQTPTTPSPYTNISLLSSIGGTASVSNYNNVLNQSQQQQQQQQQQQTQQQIQQQQQQQFLLLQQQQQQQQEQELYQLNSTNFCDPSLCLLDPLLQQYYNHYLNSYGELLFRWGLLEKRIQILKFLKEHDPSPSTKKVQFQTVCFKCQRTLNNNCVCPNCKVYAVKCTVCHISVRGLSSFCILCGHGGHTDHLKKWFEKRSDCPTGCKCRCVLSFNKQPQQQHINNSSSSNQFLQTNNNSKSLIHSNNRSELIPATSSSNNNNTLITPSSMMIMESHFN